MHRYQLHQLWVSQLQLQLLAAIQEAKLSMKLEHMHAQEQFPIVPVYL